MFVFRSRLCYFYCAAEKVVNNKKFWSHALREKRNALLLNTNIKRKHDVQESFHAISWIRFFWCVWLCVFGTYATKQSRSQLLRGDWHHKHDPICHTPQSKDFAENAIRIRCKFALKLHKRQKSLYTLISDNRMYNFQRENSNSSKGLFSSLQLIFISLPKIVATL